jgi:transcriptional regulator with XRE-family HTH domain
MWIDRLKELKKEKGATTKQIIDGTGLPERTVKRIFSGETLSPYVDTVRAIVVFLGGSLDDIFADTKAVVGDSRLSALQAEVDRLTMELTEAVDEAIKLREDVVRLGTELDSLRKENEYQRKIIDLHEYYMNKK